MLEPPLLGDKQTGFKTGLNSPAERSAPLRMWTLSWPGADLEQIHTPTKKSLFYFTFACSMRVRDLYSE